MKEVFEWERILLNELPVNFLLEVAFRSVIMFLCLIIALRALGKRGVKQLSIFEIVIIIALGSAAGDPMFYEDVGILPALVVFIVVSGLYRGLTWIIGKNTWFENLIEGRPVCIVEDGRFSIKSFKKDPLAQDEFFAELRMQQVEHLGQVKLAILETIGDISIFYYEDEEVKPGLPILPALYSAKSKLIPENGLYACAFCGHVETLGPGTANCPVCRKEVWVQAIKTLRKS